MPQYVDIFVFTLADSVLSEASGAGMSMGGGIVIVKNTAGNFCHKS